MPPEISIRTDKPRNGLYLVPVPIGNLRDITLRALDVLHGADVIAAEDTRVTAKLLRHYGLDTPMIACHEHNVAQVQGRILKRLQAGEVVALVSDAGTPLLNDPGWPLVRAVIAAGFYITALPGANALLPALTLSGLPADQFSFHGFPPARASKRRTFLSALISMPGTVILYETPQRMAATLKDIAEIFGARPLALAREISKMHEEVLRGTAQEIHDILNARDRIRGEMVLMIAPDADFERAQKMDESASRSALQQALATGQSLKQASAEIAPHSQLGKRDLYRIGLEIKQDGGPE